MLVLATAVALTAPSPAAAAGRASLSAPNTAATRFYETYLQLRVRGLPSARQRKLLWPLLTPDLQRLLEAAQREQDRYTNEHPEDTPPWCEGDLFSSLFEGAQSFRLGTADTRGNRAEVPAHLTYRDRKDVVRWTDTLVLERIGQSWRVFDIRFNGTWDFKSGDSLRRVLRIE